MGRDGRAAGGPGMAPGRQASLTQVEWEGRAGRTRRAGLLDQMDSVVPRAEAAGPGRAAGEGRRRGLRAREGKRPCQIARRTFGYAKVRHRGIARGGECASPPCPPAPTCPCAPGPGGRVCSWGPPWRPPDGGRGDCVPRGRPEGPREGPGTPGKAAAIRT